MYKKKGQHHSIGCCCPLWFLRAVRLMGESDLVGGGYFVVGFTVISQYLVVVGDTGLRCRIAEAGRGNH